MWPKCACALIAALATVAIDGRQSTAAGDFERHNYDEFGNGGGGELPLHIAVQLEAGCDWHCAEEVAAESGMRLLHNIAGLPGWYTFAYEASGGDAESTHRTASDSLARHAKVAQHVEQYALDRAKRRIAPAATSATAVHHSDSDAGNVTAAMNDDEPRNGTEAPPSEYGHGNRHPAPELPWPDPQWPDQWYLHGGAAGGYDLGVMGAWKLGYAGRGVAVSIVDDGLQADNADLVLNFDAAASYDFNFNKSDPTPRDNGDNDHGTQCAGTIAMEAGNAHCGVGIAYNASVGGLKILDGPQTDAMEAAALSYNAQHIDVYTASWGPTDDGRTVGGPFPLTRQAMDWAVKEGRGGLGTIYVWASGNGGVYGDSCALDGYASNAHTLSISAATQRHTQPPYSEDCASSMATVYSSGGMHDGSIVTTQVPKGCMGQFGGTSAAAPIAAGIVALALEANAKLTYRDVQHLVLRTADPAPLANNTGWTTNGVGRRVSSKFGYGLMDAEALVRAAERWRTVPDANYCEITPAVDLKTPLAGGDRLEFAVDAHDCGRTVRYLEHVTAEVSAKLSRRGALQLSLISPHGTRSVLLPPRPDDAAHSGFNRWPFVSVHNWGEHPAGVWRLVVENTGDAAETGTFVSWSLLLQGTAAPAQPDDDENEPAAGGAPAQTEAPYTGASCAGECADVGCYRPHSATSCVRCRHYAVVLRRDYWHDAHLVEWRPAAARAQRNETGGEQGADFRCSADCPPTHYVASATAAGGVCRPCSPACRTCARADELCTSCPDGGRLIAKTGRSLPDRQHVNWVYIRGQCVQGCPDGWAEAEFTNAMNETSLSCEPAANTCGRGRYFNIRLMKCMRCSPSCAAGCTGGAASDCTPAPEPCAGGYAWVRAECTRCCAAGETDDGGGRDDCVTCAAVVGGERDSTWTPAVLVAALLALCLVVAFALYVCYTSGARSSRRGGYETLR